MIFPLAVLEFKDYIFLTFIIVFSMTPSIKLLARRIDLHRLELKLDALLKHLSITLSTALSEEVQRLAADPAAKIAAIKVHREQTGLGLAEAKAQIEAFIAGKE